MLEQEPRGVTETHAHSPVVDASQVIPGDAVSFRLAPGQHIDLSLSADGVVRLAFSFPDAPPPPTAIPVVDAAPLEEPTDQPSTTIAEVRPAMTPVIPRPQGAVERQPRETFRGTVSTHPRLEATPKGVPKTVFRLATHPDEDTTTHLSCVAFDNARRKLAQQVYQKVHKGDAVEVVGYKQQRQLKGRDGGPRTVNEVYVAAVRHQRGASSE